MTTAAQAKQVKIDKSTRTLIGADWSDAVSGERIDIEDPATEERISAVPRCGAVDVDRAVREARQAFESQAWSRMRPIDRGRLLETIARKIEEHADELAMLESNDTGKAVAHAKILDLPSTVDVFRYMAGWCSKIAGRTLPAGTYIMPMVGAMGRHPKWWKEPRKFDPERFSQESVNTELSRFFGNRAKRR